MNDANIDNLFRLTSARPDTSLFAATRTRDDVPAFDRHLREAGTANPPSPIDFTPPAATAPRRDQAPNSDSGSRDREQYDPNAAPETDSSCAAETDEVEPRKSVADEYTPADEASNVAATGDSSRQPNAQDIGAKKPEPKPGHSDKPTGSRGRGGHKQATDANAARANGDGKVKSDAAAKSTKQDTQSADEGTVPKAKHADKKTNGTSKSHEQDKVAASAGKDSVTEKATTVEVSTEKQPQAVAAELKTAAPGEQVATQTADGEDRESARKTGATTGQKSDKSNRAGATHESADKPATNRDAATNKDATADGKLDTDKSSDPSIATSKAGKQTAEGDGDSESDAKSNTARPHGIASAQPANATGSPVVANVAARAEFDAAATAATQSGEKIEKVSGDTKDNTLGTLARFERATATGTRGGQRAGETEQGPKVDPSRFITRVARAITTAQERGGPLHLRLSPPELGSMRLELSVKEGALTAHIEADNPTAKQVLLDNLPTLRERLAEQDMRIERFDVDVRQDGTGGQQSFTAQQRQNQQQNLPSNAGGLGNMRRTVGIESADAVAPVRHAITDTSINLVV